MVKKVRRWRTTATNHIWGLRSAIAAETGFMLFRSSCHLFSLPEALGSFGKWAKLCLNQDDMFHFAGLKTPAEISVSCRSHPPHERQWRRKRA